MLHVHSCYQFYDSAVTIERLVEKAIQSKLRYVALCDTNFFGAQKLFSFAHQKGILPIIGKECQTEEGRVSCYARNRHGYNLLVQYHNNRVTFTAILEAPEILKVFQYAVEKNALLQYPNAYHGFTSTRRATHDEHTVFFLPACALEPLDEEVGEALSFMKKGVTRDRSASIEKEEDNVIFTNREELTQCYPDYHVEIERLFSLERYFSDYTLDVAVSIPLPPKVAEAVAIERTDEASYLISCVEEQLLKMPEPRRSVYRQRVEEEWAVIKSKNFTRYLLIARDFVDCCRSADAWVGPGRGSAVASLIIHLLGLTEPDPIEHGLLFERFLNPDREEPPDIDIDIEDTRRQAVIEEIRKRYGQSKVAQIVTFGSFGEKNTLREIEKIPGIKSWLERSGHRAQILNRISELPRHTSTHAAGIVLADVELGSHIPLTITEEGIVTQYDMNDLAEIGIIKFDLLGLTALSFLREIGIGLREVDTADASLYDSVRPDNLIGIFQLDTFSGRKVAGFFPPKSFSDLRILISLNRPGPAKSGMLEQIVLNRGKDHESAPFIPETKEILAETYGIPIFQEQIMQIGARVGGLQPAEADALRRAMAKKRPELMERYKEAFYSGAREKGIDRKIAETYFFEMEKFSGYAFNKAHATAYATITVWMLFLKERYPLRFYRALFNRYHTNPEKLFLILNECGRRDVPVKMPDIEKSVWETEIEEDSLRLGFQVVKGVNPAFFRSVIQERQINRFGSSEELFRRLSSELLDDQTVYQLYQCGLLSFSNETITYEGLIAMRDYVKNEMIALKRALFGDKGKEERAGSKNRVEKNEKSKDQQSVVTPIQRLNSHLAAYGLLLDYQTVFGLKFSPFSALTEIHLAIITEVSPDNRTAKGSDGFRHFFLRRKNESVKTCDYLILRGRKETEVIGRWERSTAVLSFKADAFFKHEAEMESSFSSFKKAGVNKIMIQLSGKTMEVRL